MLPMLAPLPTPMPYSVCNSERSSQVLFVHSSDMADRDELLPMQPGDCFSTNNEKVTIVSLGRYKHSEKKHKTYKPGLHTFKPKPLAIGEDGVEVARTITVRVK